MFFDTKKFFTIGQFAKLHKINKKTLMWYDEIGLLKPAVIKANGYRYYSYQQSHILEVILMLRELDVSISDIQGFLDNCSAPALENLYAEKIIALDNKISHLMTIRKTMSDRRHDMAILSSLNLSEIKIISKKEQHYFVTVEVSQEAPFEVELEKVVAEINKYQLRRFHDATYGAMIPVESLYCGDFNNYCALYIELPFLTHKKEVHIQPCGKYLRAFCKGNWGRLPDRYMEILDYAKGHGLCLSGFSYERGINEIVIDTLDDYITQIEIPIIEK